MYEFNIALGEDDYLLFNKYHFLNSAIGKKNLMTFKIIIPLICYTFVFLSNIFNSDIQLVLIETIVMTILTILWIGNSKKILLNSMRKNIRKMKKVGKLPYNKDLILKFTDDIILEITPNSEYKTKYSVIEKIAVAEDAIYIYFSSVQAFIIPISVFSDENEKKKFLDFIMSKTTNSSAIKLV